MFEADFSSVAVLSAFVCFGAERSHEVYVLGSAHYVGGAVFRAVDVFGCLIGCEVGEQVGALAYACSCALDLVVVTVGALVVF